MNEVLQFNAASVTIFGSLMGILLGVIAYFLSRLLGQFDKLTETVKNLNDTMVRIDKELSGEVGVLRTHTMALQEEVRGLDSLWDRVRAVENDVIAIRRGGCEVRCTHEGRMQ